LVADGMVQPTEVTEGAFFFRAFWLLAVRGASPGSVWLTLLVTHTVESCSVTRELYASLLESAHPTMTQVAASVFARAS